MRILYVDCAMGVAGDMLTAALLGLFDDSNKMLENLNSIGFPKSEIFYSKKVHASLTAGKVDVVIGGVKEGETMGSVFKKSLPLEKINELIDSFSVNDKVKKDSKEIYSIIANAEAKVHGTPLSHVHFHEVGTLDAVCDVVNVSYLINALKIDKIVCSDICVGYGDVLCAHGILTVPAPATSEILQGMPIYQGNIESELTTPTGAALLKYFVDEFSTMPPMRLIKSSYGMGEKEFTRINAVRVFLGENDETEGDSIIKISCNIDDMPAEEVASFAQLLMNEGAKDVYQIPIVMKKNRSAIIFCALVDEKDKKHFIKLILSHTTSWGVRTERIERRKLKYHFEKVNTSYGEITIKICDSDGIQKYKIEHEDAVCAAEKYNVPIYKVKKEVIRVYEEQRNV